MKLNQEQQDMILEFAEDKDCRVYEQYSGRCMYGSKCFGLVGDSISNMSMRLVIFLTRNGEEDLAERLYNNVRTDSMGLSSIIYFPNVEWNEGDAEKVDTDEDEDNSEEKNGK
jgi:hypothetical protein